MIFGRRSARNSAVTTYTASGNETAPALIASTSPVAWPHVHLNGRYAFRDAGQAIDLDVIVQGLHLT
jgi:hypothetical protein